MSIAVSKSRRAFQAANATILILLALICVLPFVNVIAIAFSKSSYVSAGQVSFWPKGFTTASFTYLIKRGTFWSSFCNSIVRCILGTSISLFLIVLTAYPLSKDNRALTGRTVYAWYFFFTMLINGGLIPTYIVITQLGLRDTIWALVIPGALPVFYLVLMLNFFRQLPKELEEAALIDGAGHFRTLVQIYLPVSLPSIATIVLFCMVDHWNAWFDGMLYINSPTEATANDLFAQRHFESRYVRNEQRGCGSNEAAFRPFPQVRANHYSYHPDPLHLPIFAALFCERNRHRQRQRMTFRRNANHGISKSNSRRNDDRSAYISCCKNRSAPHVRRISLPPKRQR